MPHSSSAVSRIKNTNGEQAASRLFIIEFDLVNLSGHFFNQALGFKLAAEQRGMTPCVLVPKGVDDALAKPLNALKAVDYREPTNVGARGHQLDVFADAHRQLQSLWDTLTAQGISHDDIVLITSARPAVIYSLGVWLGQLEKQNLPAIFFRCFYHDYLDLETLGYSDQSWTHRFAARDLSLRLGQERVFLTVNNKRMVSPLGRLCMRHVFEMPLPKYYGDTPATPASRTDAPIVYVHLNWHSGVLIEQIEEIIRMVLNERPRTKFLVKYTTYAIEPGTTAVLSEELRERGVELISAEQSHGDHMEAIARSDIVLLPYEAPKYRALASGVFAEGAAFGKVIVGPAGTWMSDQIAERHAAGVVFDAPDHRQVGAALLKALDNLPRLKADAEARAAAFRTYHSCSGNLDLMRRLAGETHDMRLVYIPGSQIDFRNDIQSRGYMGPGWSETEPTGVWTDAHIAELVFRCDPMPDRPLGLRICLTPFLVKGMTQRVTVSANGEDLRTWDFSFPEPHHMIWRDLEIPSYISTSAEIRLTFHMRNTYTPSELGISADQRALGIMAHEMRLDQL
jgi:glycosyltransferase involved in cell wall biosynthesis